MEGRLERDNWSWYGISHMVLFIILTLHLGPAHALYFLTYENVKHAMGGNEQGQHPLAGRKSTALIYLDF